MGKVKLTDEEIEFLQPKFDEYGEDYTPLEIVTLLWWFWALVKKMSLGEMETRSDEIKSKGWCL